MLLIGLLIGLGIYGAFALARCAFRVEEGHVAVRTIFGAAEREASGALKLYGPGLHTKAPWHHVHVVPTKERMLDLSGEHGGLRVMAGDGTVLRFDSVVRYQPEHENLEALLFGMRAPMEHITGLFACLLRNEIAALRPTAPPPGDGRFELSRDAGSYAVIRRERVRLNREIADFCKERIGDRYGVRFTAVDLVDILPPDELADALNGVMAAQTESEARIFRAQADCRQRELAAQRGVDIARARAAAVEKEIDTLADFLRGLHAEGTLKGYVARRRDEVMGEARTLYLRAKG